jgi:transposase
MSRLEKEIKTIPGIDIKVNTIIISVLSGFEDFSNAKKVTSFLGICPKESGSSVRGRRKISKGGNGTIRKILYFPTMNAIQHNKKIRDVYNRLIENHKLKKVALITPMRKLLLIAHAVYKNRVKFLNNADEKIIGMERFMLDNCLLQLQA